MKRNWLLRASVSLLALVMLGGPLAGAQADLNCEDFATQVDAQMSLNGTYPEDPNRLDADKDWIACENYFELSAEDEARVVPANLASGATQSTPEPTPEPVEDAPTPEPAPAPVAEEPAPTTPPTTTVGTSSRVDPPADLMAQVESCEVVAVSSRSIAAAGCPGVGTIVLRPPVGTPRMRSQVIIRPGAAVRSDNDRVATAAQIARPGDSDRKRDRDERERSRKKRHRTERASFGTE